MRILTPAKLFGLAGFLAVMIWSTGGSTAQAHGGFGYGGGGYGGYGGGFGRSYGGFGGGYGGFGRSYGGFGRGYSGYGRSYGGFGRGYSSFGQSRAGFRGSYNGFGRTYGSFYSPYRSGFRGVGGFSSYGYSPSYSSARRSIHTAPVVHANAFVANPYPATSLKVGGLDQGWSMLASGDNRGAMKYFGDFASTHTSAPEPKAGYALAATAAGDIETGAWAMRRALALDPNVVRQMQNKESMQGTMSQLAGQLHESLQANPNQSDASFLLSALDGATSDKMSPYSMKSDAMKTEVVKMAKPALENRSVEKMDIQSEPLPPAPSFISESNEGNSPVPPLPTLL